jgi:putative chitinase
MNITFDKFKAIIPSNNEQKEWFDVAVVLFEKYEINTINRIAGFMAQTSHESADYTRLEENLNYSANSLYKVFGKRYFKSLSIASQYARQPEKIANYVYMDANRSKRGALGNVKTGDGWKFKGGGVKQLTGRSNYEAFGASVGMSADDVTEYVKTKKGALETACWFWKKNSLENYADRNDIIGMSKKVNGGTIGLADRISRYENAVSILSGDSVVATNTSQKSTQSTNGVLRKGSKGSDVKTLQTALKITADGIFGFGTSAALKNWQRANGLVVDGIAGKNTLAILYA